MLEIQIVVGFMTLRSQRHKINSLPPTKYSIISKLFLKVDFYCYFLFHIQFINQMAIEFRSTAIWLAVLFMLTAELMSRYWRRSLFFEGVHLIRLLQSRSNNPLVVTLQNCISFLCRSGTMIAISAKIFLVSRRKIAFMVFLIFFAGNAYVNTLEKMLFADPRPFWTSTSVQQLGWRCPRDFGNPSGHSRSATYFYLLIFSDLLTRDVGPSVWLAISLLIALMTGFSRMYLGAHSADQVLLGLLLGFGWLVLYRYGLQASIYKFINHLIRYKSNISLAFLCLAHFICFIIPIIGYEVRTRNLSVNVYGITIGCPEKAGLVTGLSILTKNFISCSIVNIIFGMLFAVWASQLKAYRYYYGQWTYSPGYGMLARILAEVLPTAAVFAVFGYWLPHISTNAYLKYISRSIALWCTGFLLFYASRLILVNFGVLRERNERELIVRKCLDCC